MAPADFRRRAAGKTNRNCGLPPPHSVLAFFFSIGHHAHARRRRNPHCRAVDDIRDDIDIGSLRGRDSRSKVLLAVAAAHALGPMSDFDDDHAAVARAVLKAAPRA
jgi:hypothetical protein